MLSIGRFAEATGLTVKALRHYDEIGLLRPAHVDPDNAYRYYDAAQIEAAVVIRRLRALELPLDDIRTMLESDDASLRDGLVAHGYRVAGELGEKSLLLAELNALVVGGGERVEISFEEMPELRLLCTIRHLKLVDPEGIEAMLRAAWEWLEEHSLEPAGPPTALFRGSSDGNGTHLVEAGFPVAAGVAGDASYAVTVYPPARAATYLHHGSYDDLHLSAQRFIATALEQGLRVAQPIRAEYLERDRLARLVWPLADR